MNVIVEQIGAYELEARISHAPVAYLKVVEKQMNDAVALLYGRVHEHLDGETFQRRSGELYDSVQRETMSDGEAIVTGRVYTNSPIARIHERGGTTRPHEIVARNARALRFVAGRIWFTRDDVVFAAKVNHPGSRIPARSFMARSLSECYTIIREIFRPNFKIGF